MRKLNVSIMKERGHKLEQPNAGKDPPIDSSSCREPPPRGGDEERNCHPTNQDHLRMTFFDWLRGQINAYLAEKEPKWPLRTREGVKSRKRKPGKRA